MKEIWKQSYVNIYEVSNLGRVRNVKTKHIKKPDNEEKGYCQITLKVHGITKHYAVHRMVAIAFIPNPLNKPQVDHIDNDKTNNAVSNLRWVTNEENQKYKWDFYYKNKSKGKIGNERNN